jgi:16S rRNA (adenine1518-N6/adenine1519-N6)-dimethyltransferase
VNRIDASVPQPTLDLCAPRVVRDLLARHGLSADKRFGQHFLTDRSTLDHIVRSAEIGREDSVWEVGAGLGTLTRELASRARRVHSIELDQRLIAVLRETLAAYSNVEIVPKDALTVDFEAAELGARFVANLPYQVGTAVITRVLASHRFTRAVVLVQREVADRLVARASEPAYGSLSLWVAHHGRARITRVVPPGAFSPAPKVHSAVVCIDLDPHARPDPRTFALVRAAFRLRRKTLVANLRALGVDAATAGATLTSLGIDHRIRAEALDLVTFRALANALPEQVHAQLQTLANGG